MVIMIKYISYENENSHEKTWPREIAIIVIRNYKKKIGDNKRFTGHHGGNLVDGLSPAYIGRMHARIWREEYRECQGIGGCV